MPFFRRPQPEQALSNSHPGIRLEGEDEGGNSYEPHNKWWQSPPVLKTD